MWYRKNSDEDFRRAERTFDAEKTFNNYQIYLSAARRGGITPELTTCNSCQEPCAPTEACPCGDLLCDNCREYCDQCGKNVVCDICQSECSCGTTLCATCSVKCNNCEEPRCADCLRVCKGCNHKHMLCDDGCNDDDEFMKQCDECLEWFCRQCLDDCFNQHFEDCY